MLPRDPRIWLLTLCIGLCGANSLSLAPIAPSISAAWGDLPLTQVLWAAGGFGLGTAVSALTLAPMVDRFGGLLMVRLAMTVLAICFAGSGLATNVSVLIVFQVVAGLASGVAIPSTYILGSEIAPKGQQAQVMGFILTGWMVAMVFGVTCATLVADLLHWRFLFAGFAAIALSLLICLLAMTGPPTKPGTITSPLVALKVPGVGRGVAVTLAYMLAFYGSYPYLAPNIVDGLGMAASAAAGPILAYGIGFGLSSAMDRWLDSHPYAYTGVRIFGATMVALAVLAIGSDSYAVLLIGMGAYGVVNHAGLTLILNRLIALDPARKGAILGIYACLTYVAVTIGAVGFAPIYQLAGYSGCALVGACLAAAMMAEARTVRPNYSSSSAVGGVNSSS